MIKPKGKKHEAKKDNYYSFINSLSPKIDPYASLSVYSKQLDSQKIAFESGLIQGYDRGVSDVYKQDLPKFMASYMKEGELLNIKSPIKQGKYSGVLSQLEDKKILPAAVSAKANKIARERLDDQFHSIEMYNNPNTNQYEYRLTNSVYIDPDTEAPVFTDLKKYAKSVENRPIKFPNKKLLSQKDTMKIRKNSTFYPFFPE